MSARHALLGAILALAACATAAPVPEAQPQAPSATASADADSTGPVPMQRGMRPDAMGGMHGDGMGHMHRERMGGRDRQGMEPRMGGEHGQGMGRGEGMGMGRMAPSAPREVPEELREGERIFKEVCSLCHTMEPPPNLAPPMSHVARHLRESFPDEDEAVQHVMTYLPSPDAGRSVLPGMVHERFGLMPPQPLPDHLLEAVGRYVWFLGGGD